MRSGNADTGMGAGIEPERDPDAERGSSRYGERRNPYREYRNPIKECRDPHREWQSPDGE